MPNLEGNCKWNFATLQGNEMGQGAQNAIISHFNKSPYSSLIRESIQNSLDVVDNPGLPVIVEYSFSRIQSSEYPNFFQLKKHIAGIPRSFPHNAEAARMAKRMSETFSLHANRQKIPFIKVSDYNTKGMRYRPKGQGKSFFTSFLRVAGDSLKDNAGSGGSFGFGKAAYFNISPIRTVLVSTCTNDDTPEYYFEGGAMLTDHFFGNEEKSFFGFYDDNGGFEPISDKSHIPEKFVRDVPGTDFFIMGVNADEPEREKAYEEMILATLRNFWLAILHNKLIVRVGDIEINSRNIADLMEQKFPSDRDDKNRSETYNPRPYFDAVRNSGKSAKYILIEDEIPVLGKVKLFLNKVKDAKDKIAYMRSPRMLVYSQQFQTSYGCYGLFLCDNEEGNEFLRGLENAAHREWDPSNYKENSRLARSVVADIRNFISQSLESIFANEEDTPLGITGLEEFLYLKDDLIPSEDDDIKDNPFFGNPTGEFGSSGTSMTSKLNPEDCKFNEPSMTKSGRVVTRIETSATSDPEGSLGGNDKHQASGHTKENPAPGNSPKTESDDNSASDGTYHEFIPAKYRVIASKDPQGKMKHTLIISSPRDIVEGMIELLIAGEQESEALDIAYSDKGNFKENQVFGLQFIKGKNQITVHFGDSMKHPIILKAYEFK